MRYGGRTLLLVLIVVSAVAVVTLSLRPKPIQVRVAEVERGLLERTVVNTRAGTVKACRRAGLSPSMGGQIATWPVSEGMKVRKGDLLLALWNEDLKAQLNLAQSEEKAAAANAEAGCLEAEIAARRRDRHLALQQSGATTEEQLDTLATEARIAAARCSAARKTLEVSRARVTLAAANLERTYLHAPFDGVIAQLNGELGEYVTPSPIGVQTLPAVDLIAAGCYYVSAPIDEVDAASVRVGMEARITLDAFRDRGYAGTVKRIGDYVLDLEKQARTVEIEVLFNTQEDTAQLLAGYSADAEIVLDVRHDVLRLPSEAILDGSRVFILDPSSAQLHERRIVCGLANWDYTEVVSGLRAGEQVVLTVERKGVKEGAAAEVESVRQE